MALRVAPPPARTPSSHPRPLGARPAPAPPVPRTRLSLARDGLALLCLALGVLFTVAVFLPGDGRIAGPLNDLAGLLAGRGAFLVPIGLLATGALVLFHALQPEIPLPRTRLVGAVLLATAGLAVAHLVGPADRPSLERAQAREGGGMFGHLLGSGLLEWLGGPLTGVLLGTALAIGLLLIFNLTLSQVVAATFVAIRLAGRGARGGGRIAARVSLRAGGAVRQSSLRGRLQAIPLNRFSHRSRPGSLRSAPFSASAVPLRSGRPDMEGPPRPRSAVARVGSPSNRIEAAVQLVPTDPPRSIGETRTVADTQPAVEASVRDDVAADAAPAPLAELEAPIAPAPTWQLPPSTLFHPSAAVEDRPNDLAGRSAVIEKTLASFGIEARVVEANEGPTVTQFGIEPAAGVAVSRILSRQHDLALRLGASPIRVEAPVPGKRMVGVEVPNTSVGTVTVQDVFASGEWARGPVEGKLRLALGRDVAGGSIVGDLARMPHLLIAGATGAGKSVCINSIIGSLLAQFTPDEVQLLLVDPKRVELLGYADIPHLRLPVVAEMDRVVGVLKWVVLEMERRYKLFATHGARNLEGYNRWVAAQVRANEVALPYLVVVIDELADMMMTAAEEVEKLLCRLAQLARATGIHLVVATQRPSVDVLTGLIKANFPTRIAFAVSSQTDSRVILDQAGAEKLLGRGDALFLPPDAMKPVRLQGAFVSDDEIRALVDHWKLQGPPRYSEDDLAQLEALGRGEDEDDDVYDRAVELAETVGRLSVSLLQRRLGLGRPRAQRLLERLVEEGIAEE